MKSLFFLILGAIAIFATHSSAQTVTARQAIIEMQRGINIGNTLDGSPNETSWGNPAIQEYYFQEFRRVGVQNVRIPITWGGHADQNYPYTVNAAFMDRVEQVVDWALKYDLYVIINMHHENWIKSDFNGQKQRFYAIWTQIIQRFKNKNQKLCFEILNEPTCGTGSLTQAQIDEINKAVLAQVRAVSPTRLVLYGGTMWSNADRLLAAAIPDKNDQYLIGYYHAYDPFGMAHQCEYQTMTNADIQNMTKKYADVSAWSKKNNIPAIIDEFGCKKCINYAQRVEVHRLNRQLAEQYGIAFSVWDDGGDFQIYKRKENAWYDEIREALFGVIQNTPVSGISLNPKATTIEEGGRTAILATTITPTNASNTAVTWTSSNEMVATISNGIVTSINPGSAVITVRTADGNYTASCSVTVTEILGQTLPAKIEAENYLRQQGTQTQNCSEGSLNVGWIDAQDWLDYRIISPSAETYSMTLRVASLNGGGIIQIQDKNQNVLKQINIPVTNDWQAWTDVTTDIAIAQGKQDIRFYISQGGFNLNWIEFAPKPKTQTITLQAGWNLFSINIVPTDPTIETLFKGLDVQEIKTMDTYWRKGQASIFNGLQKITSGEGYLVNMNTAGTLSITGTPVQTRIIASQQQGWQLIGCPYQTATPFSQDFNATNCSAVKNFEGFWIPDGTSNSLQNREAGKGYFLMK